MPRVEAKLALAAGGASVTLGTSTLRLDPKVVSQRPRLKGYNGRIVAVSVHLEKVDDAVIKDDAPIDQRLNTTVDRVETRGSDLIIHGTIDATPVNTTPATEAAGSDAKERGPHRGTAVVARFNALSNVRVGDRVAIAVDTARLGFFDLDTGLAIWD
jgi:multiple sugar transport system ATP-binding protein